MRHSQARLERLLIVGLVTSCAPRFTGTTERFDLASAAVDATYAITVWLPRGPASSVERPVLFQLDGESQAESVATSAEALGFDIIVVGIAAGGPANRFRDYTPSEDARFGAATGGAAAFSTFLSSELIPRIEADHRASPQGRTLMGHSLGGLAVVTQLLAQRGSSPLFANFGAASPALWWDSGALLQVEQHGAASGIAPRSKLFISTADVESTDVVFYANELVARLRSRASRALTVKTSMYANTGHSQSWEKAYPDALEFFYGP
jgi:predicted alpha/beta superfamily hydrolase